MEREEMKKTIKALLVYLKLPNFRGRCACSQRLEVAHNKQLDILFWNCFRCFPMHKRVDRNLIEEVMENPTQ